MTPAEHENPHPSTPSDTTGGEAHRPAIRTWTSEQLFGDAKEARIVHRGETYRLLRTRSQKLILVK